MPGEIVANLGGQITPADTAVEEEDEIANGVVPARRDFPEPPPRVDRLHWPGNGLAADDRFDQVRQAVLRRRLTLSRADYLGHLTTVSAIRVL